MLRTMMSGSVARTTSSARRATDASAPGTVRSEIEEIGMGACAIGTQIIGLRLALFEIVVLGITHDADHGEGALLFALIVERKAAAEWIARAEPRTGERLVD